MKEFYQIWFHVCACAHACMCVVLNISIMSSQVLFWLWLLKLVAAQHSTAQFRAKKLHILPLLRIPVKKDDEGA